MRKVVSTRSDRFGTPPNRYCWLAISYLRRDSYLQETVFFTCCQNAAVTLRHLVHPRHTSAFHYGCKKCGLHFASPEHLASHTEQTSCNEDMVWPTTVTPGSRCVTRAEAAELERTETSPGKATTPKAEAPVSESKPAKRAASVEEEQDLPTKR
jgi:hypothetical protein